MEIIINADETKFYAAQFDAMRSRLGAAEPSWVRDLRQAAITRFEDVGFPTRHDEEWRFTPIAPIVETLFAGSWLRPVSLSRTELASVPFAELGCTTLVFVNGHYSPHLSVIEALPQRITVTNLADVLAKSAQSVQQYLSRLAGASVPAFAALNAALFTDGAVIAVPAGMVVEDAIHILHVSTAPEKPTASYPRNLIIAGENSHVTVIESFVGLDDSIYLTNAVTEVFVAPNAYVDHYKLQQESLNAFHVGKMMVSLGSKSTFVSHAVTLGGSITRNDIDALMGGEYAECTLNGLYLANGRRIVDNHTTIDHALPNCPSHEVYKGILDDRARGVFNGKIFVREDAQKTDAKQTNKTLLLSDSAQIYTKPQLEIFADDVKCTHGATVGQLDDNQLFYLQARGIGKQEARNLLVYAFASDLVSRIKVESARDQLDKQLFSQLAQVAEFDRGDYALDLD